ncbi:hypothetical protein Fmac_013034 [Flemingia macrophylla]|uniref:Uncharacterized protein n=1 Tax=Flemingia macrophylla TaxID=520843 RepID=A0ABD1MS20_9FABA
MEGVRYKKELSSFIIFWVSVSVSFSYKVLCFPLSLLLPKLLSLSLSLTHVKFRIPKVFHS